MEYKELTKKKESELHSLLSETREKLRELRFKDASKQLKNVREIREVKKTIARILMLMQPLKKKSADQAEENAKD